MDIGSMNAKHCLHAIFLSSFFFYETLFNIENLPFEEKLILPDIYWNFDFNFCLGTRNFSRVDLQFCFWMVKFLVFFKYC